MFISDWLIILYRIPVPSCDHYYILNIQTLG